MKKNAIALAVGALCIAPAAQAQIVFGNDTIGTMQIYGKLYPQVTYATSKSPSEPGAHVSTLVSATGTCGSSGSTGGCSTSTPGGRTSVDANNSYLGFRGERKFGSTGLKGIWQIEQAVELDTGNEDATFSNRNSFLGLAGGFGTIKLGNMDTIYKEYGAVVGLFGLTSGNFISPSNMLSQIGVGNSSAARFHERAPNSIQYQTPEFAGFQAGLQYSPDESRNDVSSTSPAQLSKSLWSGGVKYEKGPMYFSVQHEVHFDRFGGSNNVRSGLRNFTTIVVDTSSGETADVVENGAHSRDSATRFSATYKLGKNTFAFDISRLSYNETSAPTQTASRFKHYDHVTWDLGWEGDLAGPWKAGINYVRAEKGKCEVSGGVDCTTDGLTGQMITGGLGYDLDKSTFLYLIGAHLINGDATRYRNGGFNPTRGADVDKIALGMAYKF